MMLENMLIIEEEKMEIFIQGLRNEVEIIIKMEQKMIIGLITYNGKYRNGKKIGMWVQCLRQNGYQSFQEIGEKQVSQIQWIILKWLQNWYMEYIDGIGWYDERGSKHGKWVELDENSARESQITYQGEYNNGQKVGLWNLYWSDLIKNKN
ncbi:unnamed protein product [Paramecium primaurelia]|uniref:Uncharacterized protein n=1 Tax=Paramecium primaurelia TaxID=5886 RepID=A0A8S1QK85_PARPR|nr:unnamed protein product [Paramecium primaurelia]